MKLQNKKNKTRTFFGVLPVLLWRIELLRLRQDASVKTENTTDGLNELVHEKAIQI
tara:strand:+ start:281 stop:448 length:168 start_codon:yes stop_codon:yes gene_type:complete